MGMGGAWEVVEQNEWQPSAEPVRTAQGWEVVSPEMPAAPARPWFPVPSQRIIDLVLGTVIHVSVGMLLGLAVLKLLIELAV